MLSQRDDSLERESEKVIQDTLITKYWKAWQLQGMPYWRGS